MRESSGFAPYPRTPPLWWALQVRSEQSMWGSSAGQPPVICCGTDFDAHVVAPLIKVVLDDQYSPSLLTAVEQAKLLTGR